MNFAAILYLMDICRSVETLLILVLTIGTIAVFMYVIFAAAEEEKDKIPFAIKYYLKRVIPICIVLVLIPSKITLLTFISYDYLKNSNLPPKLLQAIEIKLDEIIDNKNKEKK